MSTSSTDQKIVSIQRDLTFAELDTTDRQQLDWNDSTVVFAPGNVAESGAVTPLRQLGNICVGEQAGTFSHVSEIGYLKAGALRRFYLRQADPMVTPPAVSLPAASVLLVNFVNDVARITPTAEEPTGPAIVVAGTDFAAWVGQEYEGFTVHPGTNADPGHRRGLLIKEIADGQIDLEKGMVAGAAGDLNQPFNEIPNPVASCGMLLGIMESTSPLSSQPFNHQSEQKFDDATSIFTNASGMIANTWSAGVNGQGFVEQTIGGLAARKYEDDEFGASQGTVVDEEGFKNAGFCSVADSMIGAYFGSGQVTNPTKGGLTTFTMSGENGGVLSGGRAGVSRAIGATTMHHKLSFDMKLTYFNDPNAVWRIAADLRASQEKTFFVPMFKDTAGNVGVLIALDARITVAEKDESGEGDVMFDVSAVCNSTERHFHRFQWFSATDLALP